MKSTFILFALFFLFSIITHLTTSVTLAATLPKDDIVDINGKQIKSGRYYYIVPALGGVGGGIEVDETESGDPCTPDLVQSPSHTCNGIKIYIKSRDHLQYITEKMPLKVSFPLLFVPSCMYNPSEWIVEEDKVAKRWYIKIGAYADGYFSVEKAGPDAIFYKLKLYADDISGYVGIDVDRYGIRHLVLTKENEKPFFVKFKTVDDEDGSVAA